MGKKLKVRFTPTVLKEVEKMAANGLELGTVAVLIGYSRLDNLKRHPDYSLFEEAHSIGRGKILRSLLAATQRRALDDARVDCTANAKYLIDKLSPKVDTLELSVDTVDVTVDIKADILKELS